jgi:putative endonuclease
MASRMLLGRAGEDAAAAYYRGLGFTVVERNFRCRLGEIDLVARRGKTLVFCEVKARTAERWGDPSEAVGFAKQQRLRRLAGAWLGQHRPGAVDVRFDVISIIFRPGRKPAIRHLPAAF